METGKRIEMAFGDGDEDKDGDEKKAEMKNKTDMKDQPFSIQPTTISTTNHHLRRQTESLSTNTISVIDQHHQHHRHHLIK